MDVKDIPNELLEQIKENFNNNPEIQKLRVRQGTLERTGKYMEAIEVAKTIENLFSTVVYEYLREAEQQIESVDFNKINMPTKQKEEMLVSVLSMFMAADIIETSIMDIDDELHKLDKDFHFEMFNDIKEVMKLAKMKLKYLQSNSVYMNDSVWGTKCDDMYAMMRNKARSLMRHQKEKESKI